MTAGGGVMLLSLAAFFGSRLRYVPDLSGTRAVIDAGAGPLAQAT
jgi:hypothetical protein